MTTITVKIQLTGKADDHVLQQDFLQLLPEKIGHATVVSAEIVEGGVDEDGVPLKK